MAFVPSVLGVHIFQHQCVGCEEGETIARIITTLHTHDHACEDCSCENACTSCSHEQGKHIHHNTDTDTCKHQFKKASFEGQTQVADFKFIAEVIDLFHSTTVVADLLVTVNGSTLLFADVIQNIPDEPSPAMNCVFRL